MARHTSATARPGSSSNRFAAGPSPNAIALRNDVRSGDLIKILWHDTQGTCLFAKRLERGRFIWPSPAEGVVTITPAQLGYLLEGIDWRHPQRSWRPERAG